MLFSDSVHTFRIPLSARSRGLEIDVAKKEHESFVASLRELELDVIEMPQDEDLPESVFVEDAAVVCNNIALITKPGTPIRLKEVTTEMGLYLAVSDFVAKKKLRRNWFQVFAI